MDGHRDWHTEWRRSDREGEISYDFPYVRNLKKEMDQKNLQDRERLTDLKNKLVARGKDEGKG